MRRILMVDDDHTFVRLMQLALEAVRVEDPLIEFELHHVPSGVQCIDWLAQQIGKLDNLLVLMDIHMPKMSGIETVQRIRNFGPWERVPIAVLTASLDRFDMTRSRRSGADTYLNKPETAEEMRDLWRGFHFLWSAYMMRV